MTERFTYSSFKVSENRRDVSLFYEITHGNDIHVLGETFNFEMPLPDCYEVNQVLRALHLACGISYYKIFVPPVLQHHYAMEAAEASFWNSVFRGGLGEFLYKNQLDPSRLAQFSAQKGALYTKTEPLTLQSRALLG